MNIDCLIPKIEIRHDLGSKYTDGELYKAMQEFDEIKIEVVSAPQEA